MLNAGSLVREDWRLLALFVFVTGVLCAGGYQFYRLQQADVVAIRQAELGAIAELKTGQIVGWRSERVADARSTAVDAFLGEALSGWLVRRADPATAGAISERLSQLREIHGYQNVLLAAADGRLLMSLDPRVAALEAPTRRLVERAISAGDAVFGELFRSPALAGAVSLDVAAPILDRRRRVLAVLVLRSMAEQQLYPLLASWPTPSRTAETLLVRQVGDETVFLNPLRHLREPALGVHDALANPEMVGSMAARGRIGYVRGIDYRGVEVLAVLRPIAGSDWRMVSKVDEAEILAEAHYRGGAILGITAITIVTTAILLAAVAAVRRKNSYQSLFAAAQQRADLLEEFRATLDGIGDGVLATDAAGRVRRMNPMAEKLTGWTAAQAEGRRVEEVFSIVEEKSRAAVVNPVREVLREGRIVALASHTLLIGRDGIERPIADSGAPIRGAAGELAGAVLVFRDQSAERSAERALREGEARYRMLFEANPRPMWVYDTETLRFLAVNDAAVEVYGWTRDEFLAMTIADIRPPEDVAKLLAEVGRMTDQTFSRARHWTHVKRDGAWIDVEITSHALEFDGRPARLILALDVTEKLRAERALKASERFLRSVLDSVSAHLAIIDLSGRIVAVNSAWTRFAAENSGHLEALCEGANYLAVCDRATGEDAAIAHAFAAGIRAVLDGDRDSFELEYPCHSGSERRWFVGQVNRFGGEGPVQAVISHIDITELRRVNDELDRHRLHLEELVDKRTAQLSVAMHRAEAANHAKSAFLANMSHEIRTPMNGVLGMVEVLAQSRLSGQQAEIVSTIRDSGTTLLRLIDEILDFSKIEAERLDLEHIPLDVAEIVEGLGDSLGPSATRTAVDLSVFVSPEIPARIMGDALRLRQILYNLIGNAIKFSAGMGDRRGRVSVRVTLSGDVPGRLHFAISDNGEGMTDEVRGRLFTPFSQGEATTTRRFGGTGLGLTISKRLVDLMGGEITVSSVPGAGSTFTVTLPFAPAPDQPQVALPELAGVDCVVADIADIDADGVAEYLRHAGAEVRRVTDAAEAGAAARSPDHPLVILRGANAGSEERTDLSTPSSNVRVVLISRGRRRRPRMERSGVVSLDGGAVRRRTLLHAVAIAAGRLAPEAIPDRSEQVAAEPERAAPSGGRQHVAQGQRILVAEDDEVNRRVITEQLNLLGFAFRIASNGAGALALWGEGGYAALITDLHMPEMDGYMLTEAIRAEEARRAQAGSTAARTPILALTANALRGEAERARSLGVDEYLTKPVQMARLREVLERLLAAHARDASTHSIDGNPIAPDAGPGSGGDGTSAERSLDLDVLRQLVGDEPKFVRGLLGGYLEALHLLGPQLLVAFDRGNAAEAASIAHRLKSSSRSVGALALGDLCARIEADDRAGLPTSLTCQRALADELGRVEAEVRAALDLRH